MFLITVLGIWALLHLYVFWRLSSVAWISTHVQRRWLILAAVVLYLSYPLARILGAYHLHALAVPTELGAATWMGLLFLLFSMFLFIDVFTLGGLLFARHAQMIRTGGALLAVALAILATFQGLRPPVVTEHEIELKDLPPERDRLLLVMMSDLHLGTLINEKWLARVVSRVNAMQPDMVAIVGDLVDSDADKLDSLLPVLRQLRPKIGTYAVTGNHEFYAGLDRSVRLLSDAGFHVLRDEAIEAVPGLSIAGVDDLTARREFGRTGNAVQDALETSSGATIFLSHSPLQYEEASAAGAQLMLSGHTHQGQVWPFTYLVRMRYPLTHSRHKIGPMTLIVSRGAGTWGPRMRLWKPSEIVQIRLRAAN